MQLTGFFLVHVDDPTDHRAPGGPGPSGAGTPGEGAAKSRYSVHLGWRQGTPYLVDLGEGAAVLVNGKAIPPREATAIQVGDEITIGNVHLSWQVGVAADRSTRVLDRTRFSKVTLAPPEERPAGPEPESPPKPIAPREAREGAPSAALDDTLLTNRRPGTLPAGPPAPDQTLVAPSRAAERSRPAGSPEPEAAAGEGDEGDRTSPVEETRLAPWNLGTGTGTEAPEPTLIVPGSAAIPSGTERAPKSGDSSDESSDVTGDAFTYETVWVDMSQITREGAGVELEATTILRDTKTPHLVIHLPERTWEVPLAQQPMTIGRSKDSMILVSDGSLSRHHAVIEPRGDGYVVRDTKSTNGVWVGGERVHEHQLRSGDVVSMGRAKLVFKGGFTSDDLTLLRAPGARGKPRRRPVVFVPGLMGSELWIGSEQVWPNLRYLISNPEFFRLPSDPRIEARNIVSDVVIVPNIVKLRQYSGLGDYLVAGLGYERGRDLLEFAYDWRQDVRLAAQRLAETIKSWDITAPVTIIAHSLGTLVTRYYVERLGGKSLTERIVLMGGPHYGAPGGLAALLTGPGMLPMGMGDERMRSVLSTFPSVYQILPTYPSASDQYGATIDLFNDDSWLPEHQRSLLGLGRALWRELGRGSSVPALSIFGYGLKTKLHATIHRGPDGIWQQVEFAEDTAGDSSVPAGSAILKDSEIHPVFQDHGSLYMDDDVRMRLKVELTRSTSWDRRR